MTGVEFLEKVIELDSNPIRDLLTGYADIDSGLKLMEKSSELGISNEHFKSLLRRKS